jgi:hypothetical protein
MTSCLLILRYGCKAIKVHLKIGEDCCIGPLLFCDVWLKSLFGTEWCDQKYHIILYTTVVAVCYHGTCQLSFSAV